MPVGATVLAGGPPVIPDFGKTSQCILDNRYFCWDYFRDNWSGIFEPALIQHIKLSLIAIGIGFAISFTLAVLAHRAHWLATPVTLLGSLLYTIPSLAAFEILVGATGINDLTVEIALVSYTLLLLFTNILAGLSGVSPEVLDAAQGTGLTRNQTLIRVELPLALPAIIAGLRVAIVTVISLATVAAYLVPEGLGKPIFDGLGANNTKVVAAGVLCILLALVADALFVILQRVLTPWASARRGA